MNLIAAMLFAATYNGCPILHATYAPLVVESCGEIWLAMQPGLVVYGADGVLTVPGPVTPDRIHADSFEDK